MANMGLEYGNIFDHANEPNLPPLYIHLLVLPPVPDQNIQFSPVLQLQDNLSKPIIILDCRTYSALH